MQQFVIESFSDLLLPLKRVNEHTQNFRSIFSSISTFFKINYRIKSIKND